ncbi:VOC family protein [Phycicoccus sp. BSK3Z-2]|uniref:VOC family protein n=1 Tax=Phycicoccus avicenniae TaxID=2828860 RepID=A0A941I125_9MICO|nr:VOC family protein [Phycicoccus avicenniae]MBR7744500.1 VOC family protein [Phycicoccus avicenniae]
MALTLYAGIPVSDLARALDWYGRLLGDDDPYVIEDDEAVWDLAPGRSVYVVRAPDEAGRALVSMYMDRPQELADWLTRVASEGLEPVDDETYPSGVRRVAFHDPDGNEIVLGGMPGPG